jgi:hypothetical protein
VAKRTTPKRVVYACQKRWAHAVVLQKYQVRNLTKRISTCKQQQLSLQNFAQLAYIVNDHTFEKYWNDAFERRKTNSVSMRGTAPYAGLAQKTNGLSCARCTAFRRF